MSSYQERYKRHSGGYGYDDYEKDYGKDYGRPYANYGSYDSYGYSSYGGGGGGGYGCSCHSCHSCKESSNLVFPLVLAAAAALAGYILGMDNRE